MFFICAFVFFCKQKTAYEMRISDWSSDVCSSDLKDKVRMMYYDVIYHLTEHVAKEMAGELGPEKIEHVLGRAEVKQVFPAGKRDKAAGLLVLEIGRASCRERVCQYV